MRSRILENAGVLHVCDPAGIDEREIENRLRGDGAEVETIVLSLAQAKAADVAGRHPDAYVIGADQILECGDRWFDKPEDPAGARKTLTALRGREHRLVNGMSVNLNGETVWQHLETASLTMRPVSDSFIENYIAEESPDILASVGAYRLEQRGAQLFERIEGDYFTILGLPLLPLLEFLRVSGVLKE